MDDCRLAIEVKLQNNKKKANEMMTTFLMM